MNRLFSTIRHRAQKGGFSLIEVVIAVAIVGVSFLAILATLGVGITNDQASSQQTAATNIAASILADLRSTPGNVPNNTNYNPSQNSTRFVIPLPQKATTSLTPLDPNQNNQATVAVLYFDNSAAFISPVNPGAVPTNAIYVAHVYSAMLGYVGPGPSPSGANASQASQYTYLARINVAWPAQAAVPVGNTDVVTQYITH
jgi:prepilin-type N-terminal cleavage/methylation domain-containing protein